jgi:hypothetical protein
MKRLMVQYQWDLNCERSLYRKTSATWKIRKCWAGMAEYRDCIGKLICDVDRKSIPTISQQTWNLQAVPSQFSSPFATCLVPKFNPFKFLIQFCHFSPTRKRMLTNMRFTPEKFGLCENSAMQRAGWPQQKISSAWGGSHQEYVWLWIFAHLTVLCWLWSHAVEAGGYRRYSFSESEEWRRLAKQALPEWVCVFGLFVSICQLKDHNRITNVERNSTTE